MANTKISALTELAGADVVTADDVLPIVDASVTTTKKIKVDELAVAMRATQTEMEAATSANTTVSPSVQHYHPSAAKAWGMITPNTTVSASYPAAGVSVVKNSTGDFTVTHGVTFSSTAYMAVVSIDAGGSRMYLHDMVKATTTLRLVFTDQDGFAKDPSSFNYAIFGDL